MKKIRRLLLCVLLVLVTVSVILILTNPTLDEDYVKRIVQQAREKYAIPAASISVFNASQTLHAVSDGIRINGTQEYITDEDYFHIGSCAKSVLAYMAARIVETGAIAWDTKFFALYPQLQAQAQEAYADITLTDLLACHAGIQPYTAGTEAYPDLSAEANAALGFAAFLLQQPPFAAKDSGGAFEFLYSNASYTLAAMMLEHVSGLTYQELLAQYIGQGFGIEAQIGWPFDATADAPWGHYVDTDGSLIPFGPDSGYHINPLIEASGNLSMTASDFAHYTQTHLRGLLGQDPQLSKEAYAYIDLAYEPFALGAWNGSLFGKSYISFDGTAGIYYARGMIIPESEFGFTILINNGSDKAVDYISMKLVKAYFHLWWMIWV